MDVRKSWTDQICLSGSLEVSKSLVLDSWYVPNIPECAVEYPIKIPQLIQPCKTSNNGDAARELRQRFERLYHEKREELRRGFSM